MEMTYKISENGVTDYQFHGTTAEMLSAALSLICVQHSNLLTEDSAQAAEEYRKTLLGMLYDPRGEVWNDVEYYNAGRGADAPAAQ